MPAILEVSGSGPPLRGQVTPPGDKSISHRALILGALARGSTRVRGLLRGADVLATWNAVAQLGATIEDKGGEIVVHGTGATGLQPPSGTLEMGNSGTAMRLLAGVLCGQEFDSELSGDESLNSRPMNRIMTPLREMGGTISGTPANTAPLKITGGSLTGIGYHSPVASAQVKSCVLLAGLSARGRTRVVEPVLSRDHTERMLRMFGSPLDADGWLEGGRVLRATNIDIPADISSATFVMIGALLKPGSDVIIRNVGLNPTRDGIVRALQMMGANLEIGNQGSVGSEPVADIRVRYGGNLRGIDLPPPWVPSMIDEIPALMALATTAGGTTRIRGAAELRVKESDRLEVMGAALSGLGAELELYPDGADIHGPARLNGAAVDAAGDHRCAMSLAMLAQQATGETRILGSGLISTSYPGFVEQMTSVGATMAWGESA